MFSLFNTTNTFVDLSRFTRFAKGIQKVSDGLLLTAAFVSAYLLRHEFTLDPQEKRAMLFQIIIIVPIKILFLYRAGIYRIIWRYISIPETLRIMYSLAATSLLLLAGRLLLAYTFNILSVPLSIIIFDFVLSAAALLGIRVLRRISFEESQKRRVKPLSEKEQKNVLLIGAGRAGVRTIDEIKGRGDMNLNVRGFIDDDNFKQNAVIHGLKVIGKISDLPSLVEELSIDHVIISIAQTSRQNIRRIIDICKDIPVKVRTIPGLFELIQGNVTISRIRDLRIDDLLGRPTVEFNKDMVKQYLSGKTVMVTGAGGSIGSELIRQIAVCSPRKILLIERAEFALFTIEQEILQKFSNVEIIPLIADITDRQRLESIFKIYQTQVVFHAAAHKHVPLMERNRVEAVKNNILGTLSVGETAGKFGVESFVLISSDKAVNPTSVMGASKRVAELITVSLDKKYKTQYISVRFGNVIGSTGSVVPIFQQQIERGGPVTITHPEMKRYFMTIPEATQLVLEAGVIGEGGEIFVLDMGDPVKIYDLALDTIRLSGFEPERDIKITYTGLRPGEKLSEELQGLEENLTKTKHPKIFIGQNKTILNDEVWRAVEKLKTFCCEEGTCDRKITNYLNKFLPEAKLTFSSGEAAIDSVAQAGQDGVAAVSAGVTSGNGYSSDLRTKGQISK